MQWRFTYMIQTWTRLYSSYERQYEIFPTIHMIREVDTELARSVQTPVSASTFGLGQKRVSLVCESLNL